MMSLWGVAADAGDQRAPKARSRLRIRASVN
jgi:hypothetical protein